MKVLALTLILLGPAIAGEPITLILKNGDHLRAEVVQIDGNRVRLRVPIPSGHYLVWRSLDDFRPHCAYLALAELAAKDKAEDRLRLARFAAAHDLVYIAQRELGLARQLAGDDGLEAELEQQIVERGAAVLEREFRAALERRDLRKGKRLLNELVIRYPDSEPASRKEDLFAEFDRVEKALADARRRAVDARKQARLERSHESKLRPIRSRLEKARQDNKQGLLSSKSFSKAHGLFVRAIAGFEAATKAADKLLKIRTNDEVLVREVSDLRLKALSGAQEALLNAASVCLVRGQFTRALGHVNQVLAFEPTHKDARAMRARIETAANEAGWRW